MDSKRMILVVAAAVGAGMVVAAVASWIFMTPNEPGPLVGGDRDNHGCLGSAGYGWDAGIGACVRSWEIKDEGPRKAAKIAVDYVGQSYGLTVSEVEIVRCPGCFNVRLSAADGKGKLVVVYNWRVRDAAEETDGQVIGGDRDEHGCIGSAGYSWCEEKQKCLRAWEENCTQAAPPERKYVGNDTDICSRVRFMCEEGYAPFFDDTGCGCEKDGKASDSHTCTSAEKANQACTKEYNPVCGWFDGAKIQCFAYPCAQTYGNGCAACADDKVAYWTRGECPKTGAPVDENEEDSGYAGLPNPASAYCEQHGGELTIVDTPEGQLGMCRLPSGEECEEWAYMRGTCGNLTLEDACRASGGKLVRGMGPAVCSIPAGDYGKPCSSSDECEGLCKADAEVEGIVSGAYAGKPVTGSCSQYRTNFGCIPVAENGELATICID